MRASRNGARRPRNLRKMPEQHARLPRSGEPPVHPAATAASAATGSGAAGCANESRRVRYNRRVRHPIRHRDRHPRRAPASPLPPRRRGQRRRPPVLRQLRCSGLLRRRRLSARRLPRASTLRPLPLPAGHRRLLRHRQPQARAPFPAPTGPIRRCKQRRSKARRRSIRDQSRRAARARPFSPKTCRHRRAPPGGLATLS